MIETHEKKHKAAIGVDGTMRGRTAASVDAAGAAMGCVGLAGFAVVVWRGLERHNSYAVIGLGAMVWAVLSLGLWMARRSGMVRWVLVRR